MATTVLPVINGCILVPFIADHDTTEVDRSIERSEAERRVRMQHHSHISPEEYSAVSRGAVSGSTQPPPTHEELEAQVEAERAMRKKRTE